ncbi:MAG: D-alanine--D-alanine ligase, partial [Alphaproteobacteria bacterium]|nr:D-alanine--D-alanine ligase [Alphaproteobacteria bacterium]
MAESRRALVLYGGVSPEREVSLVSGRECAAALKRLGWEVALYDWRGDGDDFRARAAGARFVFNALHGGDGENGDLARRFEDVLFTHSPPGASALAMDKVQTREFAVSIGLSVPPGEIATCAEVRSGFEPFARPFVVKPIAGGSSIGVCIVGGGGDVSAMECGDDDDLLVEVFIPGRELTVSVLDGRALAVTELRSRTAFYDYEAKYSSGVTEHLVPAPVPEGVYRAAMEAAERMHEVLGCRGVSRSDFRWDEGGVVDGVALYLLEVNTQPGMTPTSLVPEQALFCGMDFDALVARIVAAALPVNSSNSDTMKAPFLSSSSSSNGAPVKKSNGDNKGGQVSLSSPSSSDNSPVKKSD